MSAVRRPFRYQRVHGVEFAPLDLRGKRHQGYANVFANGHRALFARCGVYGVSWHFTEDVRGRKDCARCFRPPSGGLSRGTE